MSSKFIHGLSWTLPDNSNLPNTVNTASVCKPVTVSSLQGEVISPGQNGRLSWIQHTFSSVTGSGHGKYERGYLACKIIECQPACTRRYSLAQHTFENATILPKINWPTWYCQIIKNTFRFHLYFSKTYKFIKWLPRT